MSHVNPATQSIFQKILYLIFCMVIAFSLNTESNADPARKVSLQEIIDDVPMSKVPGIILLVESPDFKFHGTRGYADRKTKEPINFEYSLRIGSISKTYVAWLALAAAEDGLLDLDHSIDTYLKNDVLSKLPKGDKQPSIRQLLNHTSGIPDYYGVRFYLKDWKDRGPLTTDLVLHAIRGKKATNKPGEKFSYSNTNYHLIAQILESVSGKTLNTLLKERIFKPLGLEASFYNQQFPPGDKIHGYGAPGKPWKDTYEWQENTGPDGGIIASATDVATWIRALFSENSSYSTIGKTMQDEPIMETERKLQGMGVEILKSKSGVKVVGHTGGADGYLTAAFYVPVKDTVIVLHMNKSDDKRMGSTLSAVLKEIISE